MKIMITETQKARLVEGMQYEPERVDKFVAESMSLVNKMREDYEKYYNIITNLSVMDFAENYVHYERMIDKMKTYKTYAQKKYNEYFDIYDAYDYMDLPKNIQQLEDNAREIDDLINENDDLIEVLEYIAGFAKKIKEKI